MKQLHKLLAIFMILLMITSIFTMAFANAAEPPCLTIIATFPVEDLTLSIRFADGNESDAIILKKEQKAWETYYRFFYWMNDRPSASSISLNDAILVVNSSKKSFECPLTDTAFDHYNNFLTLDYENEQLLEGQLPYRAPLLITMRVVLTLLIEGFIFFLFGYRKKSSWLTFLSINLVTQGALNALLRGPNLGGYWIFGYVFYEIIIFVVEAVGFAYILKEHKKGRAVVYALIANILSLILGGMLIGYLPV